MKVLGANGLQYLITKLMGVDFIVEQGTSGIWTYRKWNSGVSECWGIDTSHTSVAGNKNINDIYLPDIFNAAPIPQVTQGTSGTIDSYVKYVEIPSGKKNGHYYFDIYVYSANANKNIFLSLVARGRWK